MQMAQAKKAAKKQPKKVAKKPAKKPAAKKPVKKKAVAFAPDTVQVTIADPCDVDNAKVTLGKNKPHQKIVFICDLFSGPVALLFPGGVFVGHKDPFALVVDDTAWVPSPPLQVDNNATNTDILNYIYDGSGNDCNKKIFETDPPDIIIDNS
jgi:hypothetical protein